MQMKTYAFDVILKNVSEVSDDHADSLFAAGCDDGTPASCAGVAWIHFDRTASSLEEAIGSAVAQIQAAGFLISKVELDVEAAVALGA
jgi:hypothetical protein